MTSAKDLEALIRHAEAYPTSARRAPGYTARARCGRSGGCGKGRVLVIAAGSNAAPARLAANFRDRPATTVPVTRARLCNHAAVYAAHLALYGALPATLHRAGGGGARGASDLAHAAAARLHARE